MYMLQRKLTNNCLTVRYWISLLWDQWSRSGGARTMWHPVTRNKLIFWWPFFSNRCLRYMSMTFFSHYVYVLRNYALSLPLSRSSVFLNFSNSNSPLGKYSWWSATLKNYRWRSGAPVCSALLWPLRGTQLLFTVPVDSGAWRVHGRGSNTVAL